MKEERIGREITRLSSTLKFYRHIYLEGMRKVATTLAGWPVFWSRLNLRSLQQSQ